MSNNIKKDLLCQRWVRDEDTLTEVIYRPADAKRRRGVTGFELRPDQTATYLSIGPTDIPEETTSSWEIEDGDTTTLQIRLDTGETQALPIISLEKDRLVVGKEE